MALTIKWSKSADKKFNQIVEYLLTEWDEEVTRAFVQKTFDFLDILAEFPELGIIENKKRGIRGFTLIKQINIFYSVEEDQIIILDFFDNRQRPQNKKTN